MSGISAGNLQWVLNFIEGEKREGETFTWTVGGPCDKIIIDKLRELGYEVEEFSDFEIISW